MKTSEIVIFTDLDGTLLGRGDYDFSAALPALEKINRLGIPLILNSSKTLPELLDIRAALDNRHPFVAENGAAIFIPEHYFPGCDRPLNRIFLGAFRERILTVLNRIRKSHGFAFRTFSDLSSGEIAEKTGLSRRQAEKADDRTGTEPLEWLDSENRLADFKRKIEDEGLRLLQGGRFLHVMGDTDKAKAFDWLVRRYKDQRRGAITAIALGDSQNDRAMLERADLAAVVRSHDGTHMTLNKPREEVIYTEHEAPLGWREAVDAFLFQLNGG
ncbi:MAG: HAD-IIB family hydrolase [Gammaproteobacteria bacterium]